MTIKVCSSGHKVTTKNAIDISRQDLSTHNLTRKRLLHFNCPFCKTSLCIGSNKVNKNYKQAS